MKTIIVILALAISACAPKSDNSPEPTPFRCEPSSLSTVVCNNENVDMLLQFNDAPYTLVSVGNNESGLGSCISINSNPVQTACGESIDPIRKILK